MAIAVVQSVSQTGELVTSITTPSVTTTSGNLLIADCSYYKSDGSFTSVTDSKSNTYTDSIAEVLSSANSLIAYRQQYKENGAGGSSHTFTLQISGSSPYPTMAVKEVSGAVTSGALDKTATKNDNSGTTGGTSSATATTAQADELLAGAAAWSSAT